jgi:hypothetical protein
MLMRAIAAIALALAFGAAPATASDPPPGEYTYDQGVELGLPAVADFEQPEGMPVCPPLENPDPALPDDAVIPDNAPSCWMPPEEQGLVYVVPAPGDPEYSFHWGDPVVVPSAPFSALATLGVYDYKGAESYFPH